MLYSILFAVLVAYVLCTPIIVVKSIQFGMSLSKNVEKVEEKPVFFNIPKKKKKPKIHEKRKRKSFRIMPQIWIRLSNLLILPYLAMAC